MKTVVVDAWAVMAWLQDEAPASAEVDRVFAHAEQGELRLLFSLVNAGEVFYSLWKNRHPDQARRFRAQLPALPLVSVKPETEDIWRAAELKAKHKISYADAFAAGLALANDAELLTGDPEFESIKDLRLRRLVRRTT